MELLIALLFITAATAEYHTECVPPGPSRVSVEQSANITGRIFVKYCTEVKHGVTGWNLELRELNVSRDKCSYKRIGERRVGQLHSRTEMPVQLQINCSNICLSTFLDLIWTGCYRINTHTRKDPMSNQEYHDIVYIDNAAPTVHYYTKALQIYKDFDNENELVVHWYQGVIPIEEFSVELTTNGTLEENPMVVTENCTSHPSQHSIRCVWTVPVGCYNVRLIHRAPWTSHSVLETHASVTTVVCHEGKSSPVLGASTTGSKRAIWIAGVTAIAIALLALLWRVRARRRNITQPIVKLSPRPVTPPVPLPASPVRILLLYAREENSQPLIRALTQLLDIVAPGEVLDLYSGECVARAAPAAVQWLRQTMAQSDTKVVLLQTPLLMEICNSKTTLILRPPHPSDHLLPVALRDIVEQPQSMPYTRFYIATLSSLPVEALPSVACYRRYPLPDLATRLLLDLSPEPRLDSTQLQLKLEEFSTAVDVLVETHRKKNESRHHLLDFKDVS